MGKKSKRKRNPTYQAGLDKGIEIGKRKAFEVVVEVLTELSEEKGVGPVMKDRIIGALEKIPRTVKYTDDELE